jgi:ubiquinone/menaquinone biosynthesis C-methylase UbiE
MGWVEVYDSDVYTIQYPWSTVVSFVCKHTKKGMRVLDVGCGLGNNFQPVVDRGGIPVGLDISATALAKARDKYPTAELHEYKFEDDWAAIADNSIDVAYDSKGLTTGSLSAIKAGLASTYRCMKPGAKFLWWTMSDGGDWSRAGDMSDARFVESSKVKDIPNGAMFRGYTFLSLSDCRLMAAKIGFTIDVVTILRMETLNSDATRRVMEHFVIEMAKPKA